MIVGICVRIEQNLVADQLEMSNANLTLVSTKNTSRKVPVTEHLRLHCSILLSVLRLTLDQNLNAAKSVATCRDLRGEVRACKPHTTLVHFLDRHCCTFLSTDAYPADLKLPHVRDL